MQLDKETEITLRELPLRANRGYVIVEPFYDSDRIGAIWMPEEAKNPQAQQGLVLATAVEEFPVGDHIIFKPYTSKPFKLDRHEYLAVPEGEIVARREGEELYPRHDSCMIAPQWEGSGVVPHGNLVIPQRVFESPPIAFGLVVRVGRNVREVRPSNRVALPGAGGHEVGVSMHGVSNVWYFIPERDLLAIMED